MVATNLFCIETLSKQMPELYLSFPSSLFTPSGDSISCPKIPSVSYVMCQIYTCACMLITVNHMTREHMIMYSCSLFFSCPSSGTENSHEYNDY